MCHYVCISALCSAPRWLARCSASTTLNATRRHWSWHLLGSLPIRNLAKIWCKWMRQDATRLDKIMKRKCVKMCQELSIVTMDSRCIRCSSMCEEWPDIRCDRDWENMHDAWCRFEELALRSQNARYLKFKKAATCSHSSGLKWPQVAARGRLDLKFPKQRHLHHLQPLAGSCSHLQPLAATRVAASGR